MTAVASSSRQPSPERRSRRAHEAVLAGTRELVQDRGYAAVTVDAIAARAGVSKATIYRWWPNKAAIVMEGFLEDVAERIAFSDTGSLREDLLRQTRALAKILRSDTRGRTLRSLVAEAQHDPQLAAAIRERWIAPRRLAVNVVLDAAVERGELDPELDRDAVIDVVYGPLYFRLLVGHAPLDDSAIATIVDTALAGIRRPT